MLVNVYISVLGGFSAYLILNYRLVPTVTGTVENVNVAVITLPFILQLTV